MKWIYVIVYICINFIIFQYMCVNLHFKTIRWIYVSVFISINFIVSYIAGECMMTDSKMVGILFFFFDLEYFNLCWTCWNLSKMADIL